MNEDLYFTGLVRIRSVGSSSDHSPGKDLRKVIGFPVLQIVLIVSRGDSFRSVEFGLFYI